MTGRNAFIAFSVLAGLLALRSLVHSQTTPRFEVAAIKPCKSGDVAPVPGAKSGRGGRVSGSPGRLNAECQTVASLIRDAYLGYANGEPWPQPAGFLTRIAPVSDRLRRQEIKGSPGWVNADRYTIEAKAEGAQSVEMMRGPMMKALLEERFKLKLHRETREIPVYELTVGKGGAKLQPSREGSCFDRDHEPPEPEPGKPFIAPCGGFSGDDLNGSTVANLGRQLSVLADRDVIDKTGITGVFDMRLEGLWENALRAVPADAAAGPGNAPTGRPDPADVYAAARIAVQKLGLRLEPAKGSGEFLVIDHVEKPSGN